MERRRVPQSANELTALLLVEIPKAIKGARVWRQSVGGAYPIQAIKAVQTLLSQRRYEEAAERLAHTRPLIFGGIPGLADIGGLMPDGRALGVEVKFGPDRQSEDQKACQRVFESTGAVYVVARDVDECLETLRNRLR